MTYSEHVNKLFNNILMLDSDLLIKMCIKESNGKTFVCYWDSRIYVALWACLLIFGAGVGTLL